MRSTRIVKLQQRNNWCTMSLLDSYSLRARYLPAVIVLFPVALSVFAVDKSINFDTIAKFFAGGSLLSYALAQIARVFGKRTEEKYWKQWGGEPVVLVLQGQSSRVDARTLERYRNRLTQLTGEAGHGQAATYTTWSKWLRANTRGKGYELLLEENITYGFWRNSLGLKPWGCLSAIASVLFLFAWHGCITCPIDFSHFHNYIVSIPPYSLAYITVNISILLFWLTGVTVSRMKIAAFNYAERLLETADATTQKPQ